MNYLLHLATIASIFVMLAVSLDLLLGHGGLFSLCHAALYGIGAYAASLLTTQLGLSFWMAWPLAMLCGAVGSLFISIPACRLKGDAFALLTLAFQVMVLGIVQNATPITGGPYGISGIPRPPLADSMFGLALLSALLAAGSVWVVWRLSHSPFGRALRATRDGDVVAAAMGKDVPLLRIWSGIIAGAIAGLAGAVYAAYAGYIDPTSFSLSESFLILTIVALGGPASARGAVIGTLTVLLLPELLKAMDISQVYAANLQQIAFGLLLILMMYYRPQGLLGQYRFA